MSAPEARPRGTALRGAVGVGLLLAGLLCLALWRVVSGTENLAFAEGAGTPPAAHVTEGETYSLAVPGGARAMVAHGVFGPPGQALSLSCDWSVGSAPAQGLTVAAEHVDTKAETTVARFTAPITGEIRVTCANWGAVFVPDADDVASDTSGWFLLAAIVALTAGAGLGLSAARELWERSRRAREDDEVEGFVDVGSPLRYDREVGDDDAGDVGA